MKSQENITDFITKYSGYVDPDKIPLAQIAEETSKDWGFISFSGGSSGKDGHADSSRASLEAIVQPKTWGKIAEISSWWSDLAEGPMREIVEDYQNEWRPDIREASLPELIKIVENSAGGCESVDFDAPFSIGAIAVTLCMGEDGGFVSFPRMGDLRIPIVPSEIIIAPADFPFHRRMGTSGNTIYLTQFFK